MRLDVPVTTVEWFHRLPSWPMIRDQLGHRVRLEDGIGVKQNNRSSIPPASSCANETLEERAGAGEANSQCLASKEDLFFSLEKKREICSPFVELNSQRKWSEEVFHERWSVHLRRRYLLCVEEEQHNCSTLLSFVKWTESSVNRTSRSLQLFLNPIGNNSTSHPSLRFNGKDERELQQWTKLLGQTKCHTCQSVLRVKRTALTATICSSFSKSEIFSRIVNLSLSEEDGGATSWSSGQFADLICSWRVPGSCCKYVNVSKALLVFCFGSSSWKISRSVWRRISRSSSRWISSWNAPSTNTCSNCSRAMPDSSLAPIGPHQMVHWLAEETDWTEGDAQCPSVIMIIVNETPSFSSCRTRRSYLPDRRETHTSTRKDASFTLRLIPGKSLVSGLFGSIGKSVSLMLMGKWWAKIMFTGCSFHPELIGVFTPSIRMAHPQISLFKPMNHLTVDQCFDVILQCALSDHHRWTRDCWEWIHPIRVDWPLRRRTQKWQLPFVSWNIEFRWSFDPVSIQWSDGALERRGPKDEGVQAWKSDGCCSQWLGSAMFFCECSHRFKMSEYRVPCVSDPLRRDWFASIELQERRKWTFEIDQQDQSDRSHQWTDRKEINEGFSVRAERGWHDRCVFRDRRVEVDGNIRRWRTAFAHDQRRGHIEVRSVVSTRDNAFNSSRIARWEMKWPQMETKGQERCLYGNNADRCWWRENSGKREELNEGRKRSCQSDPSVGCEQQGDRREKNIPVDTLSTGQDGNSRKRSRRVFSVNALNWLSFTAVRRNHARFRIAVLGTSSRKERLEVVGMIKDRQSVFVHWPRVASAEFLFPALQGCSNPREECGKGFCCLSSVRRCISKNESGRKDSSYVQWSTGGTHTDQSIRRAIQPLCSLSVSENKARWTTQSVSSSLSQRVEAASRCASRQTTTFGRGSERRLLSRLVAQINFERSLWEEIKKRCSCCFWSDRSRVSFAVARNADPGTCCSQSFDSGGCNTDMNIPCYDVIDRALRALSNDTKLASNGLLVAEIWSLHWTNVTLKIAKNSIPRSHCPSFLGMLPVLWPICPSTTRYRLPCSTR